MGDSKKTKSELVEELATLRRRVAVLEAAPVHEREERFRAMTDASPVGTFLVDAQGKNVYSNHVWCQITGYTFNDALGDGWSKVIHPKDRDRVLSEWEACWRNHTTFDHVLRCLSKDGKVIWVRVRISPVRDGTSLLGYVGVLDDITERKRAEEELRSSEARFRSLAETATDGVICANESGEIVYWNRGAEAIFGYGKREVLGKPLSVLMPTRFHDAVLARPGIGMCPTVILTETNRRRLDQQRAATWERSISRRSAYPRITPSMLLKSCAIPPGSGMGKEIQARIFEPFFTTKSRSVATGLGLSTVYGIVKQSGGSITVHSEPGHGTTFKIYRPRVETTEPVVVAPRAVTDAVGGTETILVVEDREDMRQVVRRILEEKGYTILEAEEGRVALQVFAQHHGPIHLLLTDVVMPRMSGCELADRLRQARSNLRVLYMSGYAPDATLHEDVLQGSSIFVQKPFTAAELLGKVRQALSAPGKDTNDLSPLGEAPEPASGASVLKA